MKSLLTRNAVLSALSVVLLAAPVAMAKEHEQKMDEKAMPEMSAMQMPQPTEEHAWLKQLVGTWDSQVETMASPAGPGEKSAATEVVKPLGEFWVTNDVDGTMMGKPYQGQMTIGYDADKDKYVGSWIDSMTGTAWHYEGVVDGNKLVLEAEGTCPMMNKPMKMKEITELKDANHKEMTSLMLGENGEWVPMMKIESVRQQ
ncbi:MAG: DUF1579 domain-containing protein [Candidatus Melainabacteria bacterium]